METRCILCHEDMSVAPAVRGAVPDREEPTLVCDACRTLSPEARHELRERAMTRMLLDEEGSRGREARR